MEAKSSETDLSKLLKKRSRDEGRSKENKGTEVRIEKGLVKIVLDT